MGRGEKSRNRIKNQLKAKAEKQGKTLAEFLKKDEEFHKRSKQAEKLPRSLRKLIVLQQAAEKSKEKRSQNKVGSSIDQAQLNTETNSLSIPDGAQNEATGAPALDNNNVASATQPNQQQEQPDQPANTNKKQKPSKPVETSLFPVVKTKGLKDKKKEFLKLKKANKKRNKGNTLANGVGEKEAQLLLNAKSKVPQFGEQAAAPIDANLKRRHWTDQEKTAADRCKNVFLKQMQNATLIANNAAMLGQHRDDGLQVSSYNKKQKKQGVSEAERMEMAEEYRKQKAGAGGLATLKSLAALVRKDQTQL